MFDDQRSAGNPVPRRLGPSLLLERYGHRSPQPAFCSLARGTRWFMPCARSVGRACTAACQSRPKRLLASRRMLRRGGRVAEGAQRAEGARPLFERPRAPWRTLRRGGRVAEGARLESVYAGNRIAGSNPAPSASNTAQVIELIGLLRVNQATIPKPAPKPGTPCPDFKKLLFAHALKLREQFKQRAAWTSAPIIGSRPSKLQSRNPASKTI